MARGGGGLIPPPALGNRVKDALYEVQFTVDVTLVNGVDAHKRGELFEGRI
jgi:hypothetical protein